VSGTAGNNNGVKSSRNLFFYTDDDGLLVGMRDGDYKYVFAEQRAPGTMQVWAEPFTKLRLQKIFNLMQDPFERPTSRPTHFGIGSSTTFHSYGAMDEVAKFAATFKDFPPRSIPPSFNPTTIMERLSTKSRKRKNRRRSNKSLNHCVGLRRERATLANANASVVTTALVPRQFLAAWHRFFRPGTNRFRSILCGRGTTAGEAGDD